MGAASKRAPRGALGLLSFHRAEELVVGLGVLEFIQEELNRGKIFHTVEKLSQNPHALQLVFSREKLLAAGA